MKFYLPTLGILIFLISIINSQAQEFNKIYYERSLNMNAFIRAQESRSEYSSDKIVEYSRSYPQFLKSYYSLDFNGEWSHFYKDSVSEEYAGNPYSRFSEIEMENNMLINRKIDSVYLEKSIFGEKFSIKDSVHKIKWKITTERRDILQYNCLRANGVICDSIYVVAFFTPDLPFDVGPESFGKLPGAILSLYLPHDNISYVATKILNSKSNSSDRNLKESFQIDKKSMTYKEFLNTILPSIESLKGGKDRLKRVIAL